MPIAYVCECGKKTTTTDGELAELGIVIKRYYCVECEVVARTFLTDRDILQERCAEKWSTGLKKLKSLAGKNAPGLKLPDEADD